MTEQPLTDLEKDRVIEMAWEDRTTFDAILLQFGLRAGSYRPNAQRNET
jgi:hypothetical protein